VTVRQGADALYVMASTDSTANGVPNAVRYVPEGTTGKVLFFGFPLMYLEPAELVPLGQAIRADLGSIAWRGLVPILDGGQAFLRREDEVLGTRCDRGRRCVCDTTHLGRDYGPISHWIIASCVYRSAEAADRVLGGLH